MDVSSTIRFDLTNIPLSDRLLFDNLNITSVLPVVCSFPKRIGSRRYWPSDANCIQIEESRVDITLDQVVEGNIEDAANSGKFEFTCNLLVDKNWDELFLAGTSKGTGGNAHIYTFDEPILGIDYRIFVEAEGTQLNGNTQTPQFRDSVTEKAIQMPFEMNQNVNVDIVEERLTIEPNQYVVLAASSVDNINSDSLYTN